MPAPNTLSAQASRLCSASRNLLAACADGLAKPFEILADTLRRTAALLRTCEEADEILPLTADGEYIPLGPFTIEGHNCDLVHICVPPDVPPYCATAHSLNLSVQAWTRAGASEGLRRAIVAYWDRWNNQTPSEPAQPTSQPPSP